MFNVVSSSLHQGYESMSIDPEDFENKIVLILGRGLFTYESKHCATLTDL